MIKHRVFPIKDETTALLYMKFLVFNCIKFSVDPRAAWVDVTIPGETDPFYWPHPEMLV